jgi:hypothetical protein
MGIYRGPRIVTEGLIFLIDPANPQCFVPGDTTCTDLVQGILCTGASGEPGAGTHTPNPGYFPVYDSSYGGVFDFAGGKGINVEESLGSGSQGAFCAWIYKKGSASHYISDGRNNGGAYNFSNYSSYNLNWNNSLRYNFSPSYNASDPDFVNVWNYIVMSRDATRSSWSVNGVEVIGTGTGQNVNWGRNYRIGTRYTTSGSWIGLMGLISIYNRGLSSEEIMQNFNAHRGKFGI